MQLIGCCALSGFFGEGAESDSPAVGLSVCRGSGPILGKTPNFIDSFGTTSESTHSTVRAPPPSTNEGAVFIPIALIKNNPLSILKSVNAPFSLD
jgi:hypothetical protein